jgi:DNA-binding NtrC family response regulator
MARILIADRIAERRNILSTFLRGDDHVVIPVASEEEALRYLREVHPDLVIAEGNLQGTKLLAQVRELDLGISMVMLMGGPPSVDQVVEIMNQGVSDILVSPLDINDVRAKVERALGRNPSTAASQIRFHNLVGSSPKMQQIFRKMVKTAAIGSAVLIIGEKGVGKQLVAEQIHQLGPRKEYPFKVAHCAGLSDADLELELFGHGGSGSERRRGLLELSEGGSLCVADVGRLSMRMQARLLRFLEEQTFQRVGGDVTISADVRILATTIDTLGTQVQEGEFRSDLYYLLSGTCMEVPPLRARAADIPELLDLFLSRYDVQIAGEAVEMLMNFAWPGNVDELKNTVEQAVTLCDNNRIELRDLPDRILRAVANTGRRHKYVPRQKESS